MIVFFTNLYIVIPVIIAQFVDPEIAADAVNGDRIVQEEEVEICPEKISASCLDENVCLESTAKYCSKDAWMAVKSVVDTLQKNAVYYCGRCTCLIDDQTQSSVVCDLCKLVSLQMFKSQKPSKS